ncbi:hypothetical protein L1887_40399 [Cichorium endivia]|nr:hypothetical protein L1887_40399 [Cichorium endivia]
MHKDLVGSTVKRYNSYMNAKSDEGRMEFGHGKIGRNEEVDRLSSLPDDVIHKILSFVDVRQAVKTSVLSSRWRFIWTSLPYLDFSLSYRNGDDKFVDNLLSCRDNQIHVSSIKLGSVSVDSDSIIRILNYTFSQNVKRLTFTCDSSIGRPPLSFFTSPSLKQLTLIGVIYPNFTFMETPSVYLPVLTTLHLHDVALVLDHDNVHCLFTMCTNLKNLSLNRCWIMGPEMGTGVFNICHPQLSNLTLQHIYKIGFTALNVVAPQLKSLTIIHSSEKLMISAPALTSLVIKHHLPLQLSTQGLPSLENVDLCFYFLNKKEAHILFSLLEHLHTTKFLTLNLEILEFLCSRLELKSHRFSLFAKLKIVKFSISFRTRVYLEEVTTSTEINNYQLDGSVFTMVSCEEIRVMRKIVSTQKLITEFKKRWAKSELEFEEMMVQKLSASCRVMSCLQHIEGLLTQLPASKRDVMQPIFSSVCEEAAIVMNNINMLDSVNIR